MLARGQRRSCGRCMRVVGDPVWCARRWDGTGQTLNAHSAEELAEYLEDEATG